MSDCDVSAMEEWMAQPDNPVRCVVCDKLFNYDEEEGYSNICEECFTEKHNERCQEAWS